MKKAHIWHGMTLALALAMAVFTISATAPVSHAQMTGTIDDLGDNAGGRGDPDMPDAGKQQGSGYGQPSDVSLVEGREYTLRPQPEITDVTQASPARDWGFWLRNVTRWLRFRLVWF